MRKRFFLGRDYQVREGIKLLTDPNPWGLSPEEFTILCLRYLLRRTALETARILFEEGHFARAITRINFMSSHHRQRFAGVNTDGYGPRVVALYKRVTELPHLRGSFQRSEIEPWLGIYTETGYEGPTEWGERSKEIKTDKKLRSVQTRAKSPPQATEKSVKPQTEEKPPVEWKPLPDMPLEAMGPKTREIILGLRRLAAQKAATKAVAEQPPEQPPSRRCHHCGGTTFFESDVYDEVQKCRSCGRARVLKVKTPLAAETEEILHRNSAPSDL
ncbi:MAG TPA: hypothetical protein VIH52_02190 [Candidatus Nanoarchaeia archaeon]|nr:hypothetical protein [uncultured archaeon]